MSEISKVIASEIADFFAGFGGPGEPDIQSGEAQRLLTERVLSVLALRERAEPVVYMNRFTGRAFELEQQPGADKDPDVYIPLYAAPPAPVVPDEIIELLHAARSYVKSCAGSDGHAFGVLRAIDRACRAAMLDAAPAPVVPDDALTRLAFNIALYFADEETKNNKELFHKLIDHAVDDCRSFMRATIPDPVVADSLVSELLAIAKRAAEEADECANAEFSDNSMKHAREIAEWERRAAMLQPVSQPYKLPVGAQDESEPAKN
ncbi:hypothetical protein QU216_000972 [Cronobacter sakazakii]|nr:hypothetical protein [Cronobacter sakazakii]